MFTDDPKRVTRPFIENTLILYGLHTHPRVSRVSIGEDVADGQRTVAVVGTDIDNGMKYVLDVYKTEDKENTMADEETKHVKEWEPSFDLQQSFGLAVSHGILRLEGMVSSEEYKWAKERFWDKLKEEVDNHLKGGYGK